MKVIDAYWEKRNMGIETVEIEIEREDSVEECRKKLADIKALYQVVKVPTGMIEMHHMLEDEKFRYMETIVNLRNDLKINNMTPTQCRLLENSGYVKMNEQDIMELFDEIKKGIFTTDRVYLDPLFSREQAQQRYIGWIRDELDRGAELYKAIFRSEAIGFILKRREGNNAIIILDGMYNKYLDQGIGMFIYFITLKIGKDEGIKYYDTTVSTNNVAALRANIAVGFNIINAKYVFIKHMLP